MNEKQVLFTPFLKIELYIPQNFVCIEIYSQTTIFSHVGADLSFVCCFPMVLKKKKKKKKKKPYLPTLFFLAM